MNPFILIPILCVIDCILFQFGFYLGMIGLFFIIYKILHVFGFLRSPEISRGSFAEGIAFLKDYQGPYSNSGAGFEEATKILKTFKLDEQKVKYVLIGIYYDKPGKVEDSKLRYSIGIYQRNLGFPENPPRELESYCKDNNYYFASLPIAWSLYSSWEYCNIFTLVKGVKKFHAGLNNKLHDNSFLKTYRIPEGTKCEVTVELYESENKVSFYAPFKNIEKFQLYKKDAKTN